MANSINYANVLQKELLQEILSGTLTTMFYTDKVKFLNGKTFEFETLSVSGFKNHTVGGTFSRGSITETSTVFELDMDRSVEFLVDAREQDESANIVNISAVSKVFINEQLNVELDAYLFSKVAKTAQGITGLSSETAIGTYTPANILTKLKGYLTKGGFRKYKAMGAGAVIMYLNSTLFDCLEQSSAFTRTINMENLGDSPLSINTRVSNLDGVILVEVYDGDNRFYDKFNFNGANGGIELIPKSTGVVGSKKINVLIAVVPMVKQIVKFNNIYMFPRGTHPNGDGDLFQYRCHYGCIIKPDGNKGINSILVDVDPTEYVAG